MVLLTVVVWGTLEPCAVIGVSRSHCSRVVTAHPTGQDGLVPDPESRNHFMIRPLSTFATAWVAIMAMSMAAADDKPPRDDIARIQGNWRGVSPGNDVTMIYTFSGNNYTLLYEKPDGERLGPGIDGKFQIDDTAKPHNAHDW